MIQVDQQRFHCAHCNHIWWGEMLSNVTANVWIAHAKSLRCPECGTKKVNLVLNEKRLRETIKTNAR